MPRILLIDDDNRRCGEIARELGKMGVTPDRVPCILSAFESIQADGKPDLIFCRSNFPYLNAADLLEIKTEDPDISDVPVVVFGAEGDKLACYRAGCDDFIEWPTSVEECVLRLRSVLRRAHSTGIGGSLTHVSLLDLIQMLMGARSDGRLDVDCASLWGSLFFREGQAFHASTADLEGEDAFLAILRETQKGGEFHFTAERIDDSVETNITKRTDHLLLGLANVLDESN